MTQTVSRIPASSTRRVRIDELRRLVGPNRSAAARRIADGDKQHVERLRRKLQRALKNGTMLQSTAEEIAVGLGVEPESFLEPYERTDPRLLALRRLGRQANQIRKELGGPPLDFEAELRTQDG